MRNHIGFTIVLLLLAAALSLSTRADDSNGPEPRQTLAVGTKHSPPFSIKNADGQWTGISIELWKHLADELNLDYEFREESLNELIARLETGELDAAIAAISVTADRHQRVEFCHPHFTTGLGIAVPVKSHAGDWSMVRRVVSPRLMVIIGVMLGILILCGLLFWLFERNHNPHMFGGSRRQGIEMGVWWSTILLLGNKSLVPASTRGRFVAASAMIASILLLSLLTGVIASVLTVRQLDTSIDHPSDLRHTRVATVASSTAADYLRRRRIAHEEFPSAEAALQAMTDDQADAVVYDQALLQYLANDEFVASVQVLPFSFNTQEYAIALRPDSQLRIPLNNALLRYRASDSWDQLVFRYLGE